MKRRKVFEINYVLNTFFYLMLICFRIVESIFHEHDNDILAILAYLVIIFVFVVAPFNWNCYTLYRSYKNDLPLSGSSGKLRIIIGILFNLLTLSLLGGTAIYFRDYFAYGLDTSLASLLYCFLFCGFTI